MKPILLAAALVLVPAAAQAQVAAGSVPNTFDDPAARTQAAAPAQAPAATPSAPTQPAHPESEEILRGLIASAQAGAMDYDIMTDDLAAKVREQEATVAPIIEGFGALVSVDLKTSQNRNDVYSVTFANAATEWVIGINDDGKVAALLFRPAGS